MPFLVPEEAKVASLGLILTGPISVDCKSNFALESAGVDFPKKSVFCC